MMKIRRNDERGRADHGWLDSRHTFSFAGYYDPAHMGFGPLRVINEDRVAPAEGFGTHSHRDMEIITYVLSGTLAHADSMGNASELKPGDVQRMTAGTGVRHREMNPSLDEPVHFLQIWIEPERPGLIPSYEEKRFGRDAKRGKLLKIVAGRGHGDEPAGGPLRMHQDVDLYASVLAAGDAVEHPPDPGRGVWVQVISGRVTANGAALGAGDAAAVRRVDAVRLQGVDEAELLLFDVA